MVADRAQSTDEEEETGGTQGMTAWHDQLGSAVRRAALDAVFGQHVATWEVCTSCLLATMGRYVGCVPLCMSGDILVTPVTYSLTQVTYP